RLPTFAPSPPRKPSGSQRWLPQIRSNPALQRRHTCRFEGTLLARPRPHVSLVPHLRRAPRPRSSSSSGRSLSLQASERTTMELDLIVEGGTVVTGNDTYRADVGVVRGKVVALGVALGTAPRIVHAAGKYVLPGAIDVHTHFEMPFMGTY